MLGTQRPHNPEGNLYSKVRHKMVPEVSLQGGSKAQEHTTLNLQLGKRKKRTPTPTAM